ncbi:MAG: hypothetical protein ACLFMX_07745 [Halobacteriales archaeon]
MGLGATSEWRRYILRTSLLVAAFTVVLTTNFVGLMALLTEQPDAVADRVPYYVLAGAVVFVATILQLEGAGYDGRTVLTAAVTAAVLGFVFIGLGLEGLLFAWSNPDDIIGSQLVVYFIAAAAIATGIGYWVLRHWREFVGRPHR